MRDCRKTFATVQKQRTHVLRVHEGRGKSMCIHCGLVLKGNLQKHISRVHLKLKNFVCDICGYAGALKHNLSDHMRRHMSEEDRNKYSCDKCPYGTSRKHSLRSHLIFKHTVSDSSFSCHCGKQFKSRLHLTAHERNSHQKNFKFKCNL